MPRRIVATTVAIGLLLDLSSWISWARPETAGWFTVAWLLIALTATCLDIRLGVATVLLELLWGSHGYLLRIPAGGLNVSLRMGIFLVVVAATVWHLRRWNVRAELWRAFRHHPVCWPMLVFLATLAYGLVIGLTRHPFDRVFFDANAWAFFALAPAFLLAAQPRMHEFGRGHADAWKLELVFLYGAGYLIVRTYVLLFVFSHDLGGFWLAAYQWVRDTRLGEVTIFPGAFPRVFLPSMALLFPALLLALHSLSSLRGTPTYESGRRGNLATLVFGGSAVVLLLSLSRSYWLGLVVLCVIGGAWVVRRLVARRKHSNILENVGMLFSKTWRPAVAAIAMFLLALAVVRLPYPKPLTTAGVGETLLARLSTDAAVSNRWQQIGPLRDAILQHPILGNGFGAAVTYETRDPRTLAAYPDGKYTTTAFEWGYLDDLLERGLLGLLTELWLIAALVWNGLRRPISPPLSEGEREGVLFKMNGQGALALGLLALAIVHATSPYLNHPLGIGLLLWLFTIEAPRPLEEERGA